jgi:transcriptional regulator with XRE-family HTH domain
MGKITAEISTALADVIRRHREARGISLSRMAELSGVSQTYPGLVERGLRSPTVDVAHAMAKSVGCDLSDLIKEAERVIKRKK